MLSHLYDLRAIMSTFPKKLLALRKDQGLTQQILADKIGINVSQLKRYEYGEAQPTLEVIKKIALALSVTTDLLIFGKDEREPAEELKLQFEAIKQFTPKEMEVAKKVIESLILQHHASQLHTMGQQRTTEQGSA